MLSGVAGLIDVGANENRLGCFLLSAAGVAGGAKAGADEVEGAEAGADASSFGASASSTIFVTSADGFLGVPNEKGDDDDAGVEVDAEGVNVNPPATGAAEADDDEVDDDEGLSSAKLPTVGGANLSGAGAVVEAGAGAETAAGTEDVFTCGCSIACPAAFAYFSRCDRYCSPKSPSDRDRSTNGSSDTSEEM